MSGEHGIGPHDDGTVLSTGTPIEVAKVGAILVHGRGADARDILGLAPLIDPGGVFFAAPEASGYVWYPNSFLAPIPSNEPGLSSGLRVIESLLTRLGGAGIKPTHVLLLGFSQGACLALEFAARHAQRFGAVAGLSGGLIGPPGSFFEYPGDLAGTPVFLGCSDVDPHVPGERVAETAAILRRMGADVTTRLYPGMGHGINEEEIGIVREMLQTVADTA